MSLKQRYRETIQPKLLKDLSLSNIHEVPKVLKVTVNRGLGEAATNAKSLEASVNELAQITGQKLSSPEPRKRLQLSKSARECRLDVPSPSGVIACMRF
jgi:large subunit ribosomal protein L5